jgi:hypothetical protein
MNEQVIMSREALDTYVLLLAISSMAVGYLLGRARGTISSEQKPRRRTPAERHTRRHS